MSQGSQPTETQQQPAAQPGETVDPEASPAKGHEVCLTEAPLPSSPMSEEFVTRLGNRPFERDLHGATMGDDKWTGLVPRRFGS